MAKDNRIIHRGVSIGTRTYLPDEEDELAAVATEEQLEILKTSGAIEGDWKAGAQPLTLKVEVTPSDLLSHFDAAELAATYISSTFGIQHSSDETAAQFVDNIIADLRSRQDAKDELDGLEYILSSYTNDDVDELPKVTLERIVSEWQTSQTAQAKVVEVGNQNVELQKQLADTKAELTKAKADATRAKNEAEKLRKEVEDLQGKLAEALKPKPTS